MRSINTGFDNLMDTLDDLQSVDVILLQEIWVPKGNCNIAGYSSKQITRTTKAGGGLAVYVREDIVFHLIVFQLNQMCQII